MTRSCATLRAWKRPAHSAGHTVFYHSRYVSTKQSGWPGNTVDYRIWRLMQECVYIVQDTCARHERLDAAYQWHMGKHVTKRQSCWSMEKAVVCTREGKRTSLWRSAKLKPVFSEPRHYTTGSFQSHQHSTEENTFLSRHFRRSYLKANKTRKVKG